MATNPFTAIADQVINFTKLNNGALQVDGTGDAFPSYFIRRGKDGGGWESSGIFVTEAGTPLYLFDAMPNRTYCMVLK